MVRLSRWSGKDDISAVSQGGKTVSTLRRLAASNARSFQLPLPTTTSARPNAQLYALANIR